jgi:hypothetical protein
MSVANQIGELGERTQSALPLGHYRWMAGAVGRGLISGRIMPAPTDVTAAGWSLLQSGEPACRASVLGRWDCGDMKAFSC